MPRFLLGIAALLALAACDTSDDDRLVNLRVDQLLHAEAALVGTWDLITSTDAGMMRPPTTLRAEAGTETYTFSADGTVVWSGRFVESAEGQSSVTTTYRVEGTDLFIGSRREFFGIDGDRLYFDDRPVDGSLKEYARR